MSDTKAAASGTNSVKGSFFINNGTFSGNFTTPDGDAYDIRKLEPREVTDPRNGGVSVIWGGYANARDRSLTARDSMLQADFKATGARPSDLFAPEARDIPLYITLRNVPGKGYTDIGSFWNSKGRYTIFARDLAGKTGLRFGGNVLPWKSPEAVAAGQAAKTPGAAAMVGETLAPDEDAARAGAKRRSKGAPQSKFAQD